MFDGNDNWMILNQIENSIKKKVESYGTKLINWDIRINRGILTGLNEAFIIDENTKNSLISTDSSSAEIIRPYNYSFSGYKGYILDLFL
jgi:hypothetical protein